jgi:hypothetical protein
MRRHTQSPQGSAGQSWALLDAARLSTEQAPTLSAQDEMTPGAQSRTDTPPPADSPSAIRHHCHTLGLGGGVKGQSRRLPVRTAQPLRP